MRGWIGHPGNAQVDLRVDTCMDITLISEEFYAMMVNPPPIRNGLKLNLYQLTHNDTKLQGYIHTSVFIKANNAYMVPKMAIPILLGEDYQTSYELNISHSTENGVWLSYCKCPDLVVRAVPVSPLVEGPQPREILSTRTAARLYFDNPGSEEQRESYTCSAQMLKKVVVTIDEGSVTEEDMESLRMREVIDVGDLPEHLKEWAWSMLEKHEKAFGFDGRLGQYPQS
ncbi:hypothetical protein EV421DRAFT_1743800 [Armillaria borealis]|uniref:Uncharacterized protein n=1 Tax=Armillaria borealis TaxID=47425 RepID=A0AA39MEB4_9AGAR|nr:hypothetical protein EV421DRAFT_1743800 [Armillaria borealis]